MKQCRYSTDKTADTRAFAALPCRLLIMTPSTDAIAKILALHKLRDTQTRRLVLQAMHASKTPLCPADIRQWILDRGAAINTVTVYRILDTFTALGIVHKHPYNGLYTVCTMPQTPGHHGFLHCQDCGTVEEFHDHRLCTIENDIAARAGYKPTLHVSEIRGICSQCAS